MRQLEKVGRTPRQALAGPCRHAETLWEFIAQSQPKKRAREGLARYGTTKDAQGLEWKLRAAWTKADREGGCAACARGD